VTLTTAGEIEMKGRWGQLLSNIAGTQ